MKVSVELIFHTTGFLKLMNSQKFYQITMIIISFNSYFSSNFIVLKFFP